MRFVPILIALGGASASLAAFAIDPVGMHSSAAWIANEAERAYRATAQAILPAAHEVPTDAPMFRYASIQRGSIEQTIAVTGALQPVKTIEVGSQLSGQISKVYVDFNDNVQKDQPLAQIDPRSFAAKVDEAKAAIEMARANIELEQAKL